MPIIIQKTFVKFSKNFQKFKRKNKKLEKKRKNSFYERNNLPYFFGKFDANFGMDFGMRNLSVEKYWCIFVLFICGVILFKKVNKLLFIILKQNKINRN